MKKTNNQGFSLVELIIVIAIMAVLIGVLAPQFIKYVERSRYQKDVSAVEEVRNATQIALSEEAVYAEVYGTTPITSFTISNAGALSLTVGGKLDTSLKESIKFPITFSSKTFKTPAVAATITISSNSVSVSTPTFTP